MSSNDENRQKQFREELEKRFADQLQGAASRKYSAGRIGPDDDGDLAMTLIADKVHKRLILDFGKSVTWVALDEKGAKAFIQTLIHKLREIATEPFSIEV